MPKRVKDDAERTVHTYWTIIVAIIVVAIGVFLFYLSGVPEFAKQFPALQVLASQLGGVLVVTGGITLLWDLKGRRDFAAEVLAKAQVGSDVRASGLQRLTMNWFEDLDWTSLFAGARVVEVFLSYGASWRNMCWTRLDEYSSLKNRVLRVYLPDPHDETSLAVLAQRYSTTTAKISERIVESAVAFASLRKTNGADILIYYRRGDPTFACYRFDERIVVTLYSHSRSRGDVPAMLVERGNLFDFFSAELKAIRSQSVEQPATNLTEATGADNA